MSDENKYPLHATVKANEQRTQAIHDFLEFCDDKGIHLRGEYGGFNCSNRDKLLYEFIGVDMWKFEDEKRAMLDVFRAKHE